MKRRAHPIAALAVSAVFALTACSPAPAAGPETAWRELVERAAEQASAGDYSGADSTLSSVEREVATARDGEVIDAARAQTILAAAATVRADLTALIPATPTPEPIPSESEGEAPGGTDGSNSGGGSSDDDTGGNTGNNGNGNGKDDKKTKDDE